MDSAAPSPEQGESTNGALPLGTSQWRGFVMGGNRGTIDLRLSRSPHGISGQAFFEDQSFGPCLVRLKGMQRDDGIIRLRILDFDAVSPQTPVFGEWEAAYTPKENTIAGKWWVEGGSPGLCFAEKVHASLEISWKLRADWIRTYNRLRRRIPGIYVVALLVVALAGILKWVELSSYSVFLLLLPIPYLCREQIRGMIRLLRQEQVQKVGPFQFEEQKPIDRPKELQALAVRDEELLSRIDSDLALRTKLLLVLLARSKGGRITEDNLKQLAFAIGIPNENFETTKQALIMTGCVVLSEGVFQVSERGKRYVEEKLSFA